MKSEPMNDTQLRAALEDLKAQLPDCISFELADRQPFETDFGRWRYQVPAAVARCRTPRSSPRAVRFCSQHRIPVAPRSQGHTQSGQSTTRGLLLDSLAMNRILEVNQEEGWADCEAGVVWRDLVIVATQTRHDPPGAHQQSRGDGRRHDLGRRSRRGVSFRFGTQADNAIELEVVTGAGDIVVCSRDREPELFDMVRCGLGQVA